MNWHQRNSNRATARVLGNVAKQKRLSTHVCENCGETGGHWVSTRGSSLMAMITGIDDQEGFWTCPKYYDKETGRRIEA